MNPNKITCSGRVLSGQAETSEIYQHKPLASKTAVWGIKLLSGAQRRKDAQNTCKCGQILANTRRYTQIRANTSRYTHIRANTRKYMQTRPNTHRYTDTRIHANVA